MPVTICDVGPRDGLQNEPETLPAATRAELVSRLAATGLPRVEAVSFVRDDRVPQMAGAEEVVAGARRGDAELAGLVLNERGYERFAAAGLDRLTVTLAATDAFNRRNGNVSLEQAIAAARAILARNAAEACVPATVSLSCAFGCPFEGDVDPGTVVDLCEGLAADEYVLADTIGVATPRPVRRLVERIAILGRPVGFHGHNTRNTGYAAAWAAIEGGARAARRVGRRARGLPLLARGDRQRRDRGPRLAARAGRGRDRRRPGRAGRDGALARGDARAPARGLRLPRLAVSLR